MRLSPGSVVVVKRDELQRGSRASASVSAWSPDVADRSASAFNLSRRWASSPLRWVAPLERSASQRHKSEPFAPPSPSPNKNTAARLLCMLCIFERLRSVIVLIVAALDLRRVQPLPRLAQDLKLVDPRHILPLPSLVVLHKHAQAAHVLEPHKPQQHRLLALDLLLGQLEVLRALLGLGVVEPERRAVHKQPDLGGGVAELGGEGLEAEGADAGVLVQGEVEEELLVAVGLEVAALEEVPERVRVGLVQAGDLVRDEGGVERGLRA